MSGSGVTGTSGSGVTGTSGFGITGVSGSCTGKSVSTTDSIGFGIITASSDLGDVVDDASMQGGVSSPVDSSTGRPVSVITPVSKDISLGSSTTRPALIIACLMTSNVSVGISALQSADRALLVPSFCFFRGPRPPYLS